MIEYSLSRQEIAELRAAHSRAMTSREAYRINAVILLAQGRSVADVTDALLIDADTVRDCFKRYKQGGIERLLGTNIERSRGFDWSQRLPERLPNYLNRCARNTYKRYTISRMLRRLTVKTSIASPIVLVIGCVLVVGLSVGQHFDFDESSEFSNVGANDNTETAGKETKSKSSDEELKIQQQQLEWEQQRSTLQGKQSTNRQPSEKPEPPRHVPPSISSPRDFQSVPPSKPVPLPPAPASLIFNLVDSNGKPLQKLNLALSLERTDGRLVKTFKDISADVPKITNLRPGDYVLAAVLKGYERFQYGFRYDGGPKTLTVKVQLQPLPTLANVAFVPQVKLFGKYRYAEDLVDPRSCAYKLRLTDGTKIGLHKEFRTSGKDESGRFVLTPGERARDYEPEALIGAELTMTGTRDPKHCPELAEPVHANFEAPSDLADPIPVRLRHPSPWFLAVMTSAGFPQERTRDPNAVQARAKAFWLPVLKLLLSLTKGDPGPERYNWPIMTIVEGSRAGNLGSSPMVLAGADERDPWQSIEAIKRASFDTLVKTPVALTKDVGPDGQLDDNELLARILQIADLQGPPISGRRPMVLLIRGWLRPFGAADCERFAYFSERLAKHEQGLRVVSLVPSKELLIDDRVASPAHASVTAGLSPLVPYSTISHKHDHSVVYTCNPSIFANDTGSQLLVYDYDYLLKRTMDQVPIEALGLVLDEARIIRHN